MSHTNFIWTNHARRRMHERKIPQDYVDQALNNPDKSHFKEDGSKEQQKRIGDKTVAAIIKENDKGEHIVISCWINPPFPGTKDSKMRKRYLEMQHGSFAKKLWLTILNQLGL